MNDIRSDRFASRITPDATATWPPGSETRYGEARQKTHCGTFRHDGQNDHPGPGPRGLALGMLLCAAPLALVISVGLILQDQLSWWWIVPLYAVIGSLIMALGLVLLTFWPGTKRKSSEPE